MNKSLPDQLRYLARVLSNSDAPGDGPEICDKAADALDAMQTFRDEVMAGCDINKEGQGLYRQVRVVIGPGKTQDKIDKEAAEAEVTRLREALKAARQAAGWNNTVRIILDEALAGEGE